MHASKRFTLGLLLAISAGFAGPALAQELTLAANQTLTGRPDFDSHPGPGDTDINNDGQNDLEQIKQQAKAVGSELESQTREMGQQAESQLNQLGDKAKQGLNRVEQELNQVDFNDAETSQNWLVWILVALVAVVVIATVYISSRRRIVYYRR